MPPEAESPRRKFPLIKLAVVVSLVGVAATIFLVPFMEARKAAVKYDAHTDCRGRIRAVATAVLAYAQYHGGWTPTDPDYYIKFFGYRLNSEPGYYEERPPWYVAGAEKPGKSQRYAGAVRDFRCPLDPNPPVNRHGIPSSYEVSSAFQGENVYSLGREAKSILVVTEMGKRHPDHETKKLEGHRVYADLHITVGAEPPPSAK
jgi:hypothetical protein